jgi:hypothetical protein
LECGSLLSLLNSEFRVSSSQLKIAGQLGTQNWKLGTLKSGSKLPHSEGFPPKKLCRIRGHSPLAESQLQ